MSTTAVRSETHKTGYQVEKQRQVQTGALALSIKAARRSVRITEESIGQILPFTSRRERGETDWQEPLLTTKYFVPYLPHSLILRPQLMKLLDEGMSRPLTLVSAPAGFGKTTLLSAWARAQRSNNIQVAWLSLTEEDNDLTRFWTYILAALNEAQPELCAGLVILSQQHPSTDLSSLLTALISWLAYSSRPVVLILDDYHVITEQAVHAS